MAEKKKIHKGVKVKYRDRDTGEVVQVTIHSHLVADYWRAINIDGWPVDVKETEIISFVDPAGPGKKTEQQLTLF